MSSGRRAYDLLRGWVNYEWDRIKGVEETSAYAELKEYVPPAKSPEVTIEETFNREEYARKLLGVDAKASFEDIRKAFERLSKRSDPANFPAGSEEADQAGKIQKRVNWAYQILTENVDVTEKRFRSLEIE